MQSTDQLLYIMCHQPSFWSDVGIPADCDSFMEAAGITGGFSLVNAQNDELPDPATLRGTVIIGGASGNLYEPEPWMERLVAFTKVLLDREEANVFGTCFGHQVVAAALGGTVAKNPNGAELGVYTVNLTPAGQRHPLFKDVNNPFMISQGHGDAVTQLPIKRHAEILAANANSIQALSIQSRAAVVTVQFHPDISAESVAAVIGYRRESMISKGVVADDADVDRLIAYAKQQAAPVEATRRQIIRNFIAMIKAEK